MVQKRFLWAALAVTLSIVLAMIAVSATEDDFPARTSSLVIRGRFWTPARCNTLMENIHQDTSCMAKTVVCLCLLRGMTAEA